MSDLEKAMIIVKSGPEDGSRAGDGLRLSAAMLGMDRIPALVFVDDGVECLLPNVFDEAGKDYLQAVADLAGIHILSESLVEHGLRLGDLWPRFAVKPIDLADLAEMVADSDVVAAF